MAKIIFNVLGYKNDWLWKDEERYTKAANEKNKIGIMPMAVQGGVRVGSRKVESGFKAV